MKHHNGFNTRKIFRMLEMALNKEKTLWSSMLYNLSKDQSTQIGPESRDETVRWLVHISRKLKFHPETVVLSVNIFDRFLNIVKAHLKYRKVIGIACLYLSAKILEEDLMVPGALEMVRESECGCSVAELLRMERVILDKLNWDVRATTTLDFIHLFHSLLMSNYPQLLTNCVQMTPSRQISLLTRKVQSCIAYHGFLTFKPSVVALSILSLELELFCTDWFGFTTSLQNMAKIDGDSIILCREKVTVFLSSMIRPQTIYLQSPAKHSAPQGHSIKAAKRKVKNIDNEDDVYDAIKRLYNEEENSISSASCSSELRQDNPVKVMSVQTLVN